MEASICITEEVSPPRAASHGTADPMVWRRVEFHFPQGKATFEQTDYGHPGRFNPWEPRSIAPVLQARTTELESVAERVFALLR